MKCVSAEVEVEVCKISYSETKFMKWIGDTSFKFETPLDISFALTSHVRTWEKSVILLYAVLDHALTICILIFHKL